MPLSARLVNLSQPAHLCLLPDLQTLPMCKLAPTAALLTALGGVPQHYSKSTGENALRWKIEQHGYFFFHEAAKRGISPLDFCIFFIINKVAEERTVRAVICFPTWGLNFLVSRGTFALLGNIFSAISLRIAIFFLTSQISEVWLIILCVCGMEIFLKMKYHSCAGERITYSASFYSLFFF